MTVPDLLTRVREHGLKVTLKPDGSPQLTPTVAGATCPPSLLAELTRHRAAVVGWFAGEQCRACRAWVVPATGAVAAVCAVHQCDYRRGQ